MGFEVDRDSATVIVRAPEKLLAVLHNDARLSPSAARAMAASLDAEGHHAQARALRAAADEAQGTA
ncbi:MAG: hypothetical protein WAV90_03820 [Gordonia amarae]